VKKIVLFLMLVCAICVVVFAQTGQSIYVSAGGNNNNDGLSESTPLKSLDRAVQRASLSDVDKITVIGILNIDSEESINISVFTFSISNEKQILITGKPGAANSDQAILSSRGSGRPVIVIARGNVRFENIEISGGEGVQGFGIFIFGGSNITLGTGAVVKSNSSNGILIGDGTCVIDGGEVLDNSGGGINVVKGVLTMNSGAIRNNRAGTGAGVVVGGGNGRFTMTGGTITGNRAAEGGGGVVIGSEGRFDQTGGTISGNTDAWGYPNLFRSQGTLGSDLISR